MKPREQRSPHSAGSVSKLGGVAHGDDSATSADRIGPVDEVRLLRAAASDWRLSRGDVGVMAAILWHTNSSWEAFPGTRRVAAMARLAPSNVVASFAKLERFGYVRIIRRGQRKRQDFQVLPSPAVTESAPARKSSGFSKSAPTDKSSTENASAPVDMKLSAPVDRENLLLSIGTEGALEGTLEDTKEKSARKKSIAVTLPTWLSADAWQSWRTHRGKKFSAQSQTLAIRKLETLRAEGHDPVKLIELAIESDWVSFYPRDSTRAAGKAVGTIERDPRTDEEIAQANERELARFGMGAAA